MKEDQWHVPQYFQYQTRPRVGPSLEVLLLLIREDTQLNWPGAVGKACFQCCMKALQYQVEMDLYEVSLRHFTISDKLSNFGYQFFFLELIIVDAQFAETECTQEKFVFCSFNISQIDTDFLSHKVSVTPHQHAGMWTGWSGWSFSFILLPHSFATMSANLNFCAVSRCLCWYIFVNSKKFFHTSSFGLLIFYFDHISPRLLHCEKIWTPKWNLNKNGRSRFNKGIWSHESSVKHVYFWWWLILAVNNTPWEKDTQLRNCLHQIAMWAYLSSIFVRESSSL